MDVSYRIKCLCSGVPLLWFWSQRVLYFKGLHVMHSQLAFKKR